MANLPGDQRSKTDLRPEIRRTFNTLFAERDVAELRGPKCPKAGTLSGCFNNGDDFAQAVAAWDGKVNLFVTINPVDPNLLARAMNRAKPYATETTADQNIVRRRWLPIDFDPQRPTGISSTDAEHTAALERAEACRKALHNEYGIQSVLADSGNGAHVLLRLDLPNDQASATLCKAILAGLAARFDDDVVKVDQTCFNASRIIKLYGTMAVKGDSTPDRPHRQSRLLDVPAELVPAPIEILQEIAALAPQPASRATPARPAADHSTPPATPAPGSFDVEAWMQQHNLSYKPLPYNGGMKYQLSECPFDPSHKAPDSVVIVGADGTRGFHCSHNSCASHNWRALREHLEPAYSRYVSTSELTAGEFEIQMDVSGSNPPDTEMDLEAWKRQGKMLALGRKHMEFRFKVAVARWYLTAVRGIPEGAKYLVCQEVWGEHLARQVANWVSVVRVFKRLATGEIAREDIERPWTLYRVLTPVKSEEVRESYWRRWGEKSLTVDIIAAELREAGHLQRKQQRVAHRWDAPKASGVPGRIGEAIRDHADRHGSRTTTRTLETALGVRQAAPDLPGVKDQTAEELRRLFEDLCERDGPEALLALLRGAWCTPQQTQEKAESTVIYNGNAVAEETFPVVICASPVAASDPGEADGASMEEPHVLDNTSAPSTVPAQRCDQMSLVVTFEPSPTQSPDDSDEPSGSRSELSQLFPEHFGGLIDGEGPPELDEVSPSPPAPLNATPEAPDFSALRTLLEEGALRGKTVCLDGQSYDAHATVHYYLRDLENAAAGRRDGLAMVEQATRHLRTIQAKLCPSAALFAEEGSKLCDICESALAAFPPGRPVRCGFCERCRQDREQQQRRDALRRQPCHR